MNQNFDLRQMRLTQLLTIFIFSFFVTNISAQERTEKPRKESAEQKFVFQSGVPFQYFSSIQRDSIPVAFVSREKVMLVLDTTRKSNLPNDSQGLYFYQQWLSGYPIQGAYVMAIAQDGGFLISGNLWSPPTETSLSNIIPLSMLESTCQRIWSGKDDVKIRNVALFWITTAGDSLRLVYSFVLESLSTFSFRQVYMDAQTGEVVKEWSLIHDNNVEGLGLTRYNGAKTFNCESVGLDYRLNDVERGIYTYDGNGQDAGELLYDLLDNNVLESGQPFTSLEPVFDQTPKLTYLQLDNITAPVWDPCGVCDQTPDVYFQVKNAQSQVVYESGYTIDDATNLQFAVPNTLILNNNYTIAFYDYDPVSADDLLFTMPLRNNGGRQDFVQEGVSLFLNTTTTGQLDAHWGMSAVYDFYSTHFGRDSYDDLGSPIYQFLTVDTNYFSTSGYPNNAFALSAPYNVMIYGQGDGVNFGPFVSHDVMGHEYTHMVIDNNGSGGLVYQGESGALNEAIADIFGVLIEGESQGSMDWLIGEDIVINSAYGPAFRSFSNPSSLGQPDTYGGENWVATDSPDDNGGVHTNSGVLNYWFYLLVQGGVGVNDYNSNYLVESMGASNARDLVYYTLVNLPSNDMSYIGFRDVTLSIGALLFGATSTEMLQIKRAWHAVGLAPNPDAYCAPLTTLTAASGTITDGSGAAQYKENSECYWLIQPADNPNRIQLNINNFLTEPEYDVVYVFDGSTVNAPLLGVYSGSVSNVQLESTQGQVMLAFFSDAYVQANGWEVEYTALYEGCMDTGACNYNPLANVSVGPCTYPVEVYLDCAGSCLNDTDGDGICNENEVLGCTDAAASNYNPNATDDDGSCASPLQCSITSPVTSICEGESVTLSMNTTGGTGSSSPLPANLQQGLVAYYPFNGNANDESGNVVGGNLVGGTFEIRLNTNDYLGFDGIQTELTLPTYSGYNCMLSNFSISFWIKNELPTGHLGAHITHFPDGFFTVGLGGDNHINIGKQGIVSVLSSQSIITNNWTHVFIERQGDQFSIFINGSLDATVYNPTAFNFLNGTPMRIGYADIGGNNGNYRFQGGLDDISIYNRALSPSEIQLLYTAQSYAWSTGATTNSINVTPTTNTTYSCTVTQGSQTCTASVDITVNPQVPVSAQIEQVLAADQPSFTLNMNANAGFSSSNLSISPVVANNNSSTAALLNNTNASSGYANASGGNNMAISAATGALNANTSSYFQWNIQVGNVQSAILDNLSFGYRSSTSNAGPTQYCIRSSADNFTTNIAQGSISNTSTWLWQNSALALNLPSNATTTMRLYVFGGTGISGNVNFRMDDLSWNFTTTTASCSDQGVQFLSNVSNAIDNPTYSWLVNGSEVSTASSFSSNTLAQNDQVHLLVTPTTGCYVSGPTASNVVSVAVNSSVTPTVVLSNDVVVINSNQLYNMTTSSAATNTVTNGTVGVSYSGFAASASNVSSGYAGASGGNNMVASIPTGVINTNQYVAISVSANAGFALALKGLAWGYRSSAANGGPKFYVIRSSSDNYAQDLTTGSLVNNSLWQYISLANLDFGLVQSGAPVNFRVYFHGGTTVQGASNFRIDDWSMSIQEQAIPCNTQSIQFTANLTNGGTSPHYNWKLNGVSVGSDAAVYTASNYQNGDAVTVVVQTNAACQTTSSITSSSLVIEAINGQVYYQDLDNDGFGNVSVTTTACNQPAGYVSNSTDCNDASSAINTAAEEICNNQIDDNCDGQVDENCAVLGCTNVNACNFNPLANTDDNSCILPQPEICDGLDNNCNNQIDEGLSPASINAVAAITALYPVCSGNSIRSANLNNGVNSPAIEGNGNDLWYSFTAQFNTFRAGLSAASGDNDLRLFTITAGGCLSLIETEHETTSGNQTLLTDQLTVGQTYYVAVHSISGPMNTSAKICFNHLSASSCDHYYSNNTGIYTSVCNSFKALYRANAVAYTFEILSAAQNGVNQNITPWSYTTPTSSTVVARLGTLLPANQGTSPIVYTMRVPVFYSLFDAAGNFENLNAQATSTCTTTLNAEPTIALRSSDRCPNNKSIASTIAPDRTVCGAMRYDWEFTEVLPNPGTAQVVQGGAYSSAFFLSNIPGVAAGKTYNVRVRSVHSSGVAGNWGSVQCLRIGSAGMILQSENQNESGSSLESRVPSVSIYPNPTMTGSFVLEYNGSRRGESIFAQEPTTTESTVAQEPTTTELTQELVMLDITGKEVFRQQVVLNGNAVEVQFGDLASGVYLVMVGEERLRLQLIK